MCASAIFSEDYTANEHISLSILLGADNSHVRFLGCFTENNFDSAKQLQKAFIRHYKDLCKKGVGHLTGISDHVKEEILNVEKLDLNAL